MGPDGPVSEADFLDRVGGSVERACQHQAIGRSDPEQQIGGALLLDLYHTRRDARAQFDPVDPSSIGDRVLPVANCEAVNIVPRVARDCVVAQPADEDVVPDVASQAIVAPVAK